MNSLVRIKKEYKEISESKDKDNTGISAVLVDNSYTHWKGVLYMI